MITKLALIASTAASAAKVRRDRSVRHSVSVFRSDIGRARPAIRRRLACHWTQDPQSGRLCCAWREECSAQTDDPGPVGHAGAATTTASARRCRAIPRDSAKAWSLNRSIGDRVIRPIVSAM
jgi:hypothetical protein